MRPFKVPFGLYAPDAQTYASPYIQLARDCVPSETGYKTMPLAVEHTTSGTVSAKCRGAFSSRKGGTIYDFAGDATKLYRISQTTITDATRVSGGAYAMTASAYWDFSQYGDYVIAVNGADASNASEPQVFELGVSSNFANLGGSPPKAATVAAVRDFVVLGNTYDGTDGLKTNRVRWSAFGDHTSWTPSAATQADFQDLQAQSGSIQRITGGHNAFVVCEHSTYLMTYVGPPTIFRFDEFRGYGTESPHSVVRVGDSVYMHSKTGFIRLDAQGGASFLGEDRVDRTVWRNLRTTGDKVIGAYDEANKGILWLYDVTGAAAGLGYFYHIPTGKWSTWQNLSGAAYAYSSGIAKTNANANYTVYFIDTETGGTSHLWGFTSDTQSEQASITSGYFEPFPGKRGLLKAVRPIADPVQYLDTNALTIQIQATNDLTGVFSLGTATFAYDSSDGFFKGFSEGRYFKVTLTTTQGGPAQINLNGVEIHDYSQLGTY